MIGNLAPRAEACAAGLAGRPFACARLGQWSSGGGCPGWPSGGAGLGDRRLAAPAAVVVAVPDRGEPRLGGVELAGDHVLDVGLQRGVRAHNNSPFYYASIFEFGESFIYLELRTAVSDKPAAWSPRTR